MADRNAASSDVQIAENGCCLRVLNISFNLASRQRSLGWLRGRLVVVGGGRDEEVSAALCLSGAIEAAGRPCLLLQELHCPEAARSEEIQNFSMASAAGPELPGGSEPVRYSNATSPVQDPLATEQRSRQRRSLTDAKALGVFWVPDAKRLPDLQELPKLQAHALFDDLDGDEAYGPTSGAPGGASVLDADSSIDDFFDSLLDDSFSDLKTGAAPQTAVLASKEPATSVVREIDPATANGPSESGYQPTKSMRNEAMNRLIQKRGLLLGCLLSYGVGLPDCDSNREENLRTVNIAELREADSASHPAVRGLRQACCETGFFLVKGHELSQDVLDEMFDMAKDFFQLPLDAKLTHSSSETSGWRGYNPYGSGQNCSLSTKRPERKETFYCGEPPGAAEGIPEPLPAFYDKLRFSASSRDHVLLGESWRFHSSLLQLSRELLRGLSLALGLPADHFELCAFQKPIAKVLLAYYPPAGDGDSSCGAHTDCGFLTLVCQDSAEAQGLQVQKPDGSWLSVKTDRSLDEHSCRDVSLVIVHPCGKSRRSGTEMDVFAEQI
eukprot:s2417_g12.t1